MDSLISLDLKAIHLLVFGSEKSTGQWDDVTKERHKISPLGAPLAVQKSEPVFTSSSLTKSFLESQDFEMTSLRGGERALPRLSLGSSEDKDVVLSGQLLLILHRGVCTEMD